MTDKVIKSMQKFGYYYDDINSYKGYYVFNGEYCTQITFTTIKDINDWMKNVIID